MQYLSLTFQECMQSFLHEMARNRIKAYIHTAFLKIFRVVHEKKNKNALEVGDQHFKRSPNFNISVVKYQLFTKLSIRWPVSRYIL